MKIEIVRASSLGGIRQTLGIPPDTRVCFERFQDQSCEVWDLNEGVLWKVSPFATPVRVTREAKVVPEWLQEIIRKPTPDLLAEWNAGWQQGSNEQRHAAFTELSFRGVSTL